MTAVRTLNSPPDSNVKPSEILKVANSFWERVQPEKMANAAHLDFPIIFMVITIHSHHGISTSSQLTVIMEYQLQICIDGPGRHILLDALPY